MNVNKPPDLKVFFECVPRTTANGGDTARKVHPRSCKAPCKRAPDVRRFGKLVINRVEGCDSESEQNLVKLWGSGTPSKSGGLLLSRRLFP